jgi:hypothetical protein
MKEERYINRQILREEIYAVFREKKGEFEELKTVIDPARIKAEIRLLVTNIIFGQDDINQWDKAKLSQDPLHLLEETKQLIDTINEERKNKNLKERVLRELTTYINQGMMHRVEHMVNEFTRNELKKIVLKDEIKTILRDFEKNNFKNLVKEIVKTCDSNMTKKITQRLQNIVKFRTSSLQEVQQAINYCPPINHKLEYKEILKMKKQGEEEKTNNTIKELLNNINDPTFKGDKKYLKYFNENGKI